MTSVIPLRHGSWGGSVSPEVREQAVSELEAGNVLFFPELGFELSENERAYLNPATVGESKNVSYDPRKGSVGGAAVAAIKVHELRALLDRFARSTRELLHVLLPYGDGLQQARTSLRPVEVAGRKQTWRKDDTRLHVDSFPSLPSGGKRILRVFSNVNPDGKPRVWRVGDNFNEVASRYWNKLRAPLPGERHLLAAVRVTKAVRTQYDHYILKLHDAMKQDVEYQDEVAVTQAFPAGSTWVCFTDQVSHAAVSGIHQFEQTFWVDVKALRNPDSSPLRVLENLAGRKLA